jgi:hypothetical protein
MSEESETPIQPEAQDDHPEREEEPGVWSDHDSDWVLQGRMP